VVLPTLHGESLRVAALALQFHNDCLYVAFPRGSSRTGSSPPPLSVAGISRPLPIPGHPSDLFSTLVNPTAAEHPGAKRQPSITPSSHGSIPQPPASMSVPGRPAPRPGVGFCLRCPQCGPPGGSGAGGGSTAAATAGRRWWWRARRRWRTLRPGSRASGAPPLWPGCRGWRCVSVSGGVLRGSCDKMRTFSFVEFSRQESVSSESF